MTLDENTASAVLRLTDADYERRVRTTDDRGRATSYTLVYQVRVEVIDKSGESLIDPFRVTTRRDLPFDRTRVLQAEEQERDLREDMRVSGYRQIPRSGLCSRRRQYLMLAFEART